MPSESECPGRARPPPVVDEGVPWRNAPGRAGAEKVRRAPVSRIGARRRDCGPERRRYIAHPPGGRSNDAPRSRHRDGCPGTFRHPGGGAGGRVRGPRAMSTFHRGGGKKTPRCRFRGKGTTGVRRDPAGEAGSSAPGGPGRSSAQLGGAHLIRTPCLRKSSLPHSSGVGVRGGSTAFRRGRRASGPFVMHRGGESGDPRPPPRPGPERDASVNRISLFMGRKLHWTNFDTRAGTAASTAS